MTPCERFREDLAAHVYGDLDPAAEAALERHLASCAGCREEKRTFQRLSHALKPEAMFPGESQIDWDAFARSTVQRATGFRPSARPSSREGVLAAMWRRISRAPALAAAGASLLVVAGVALGTYAALGNRRAPAIPAAEIAGGPADMVLPSAMLSKIEETSARGSARRYLSESRALLTSLISSPVHCDKGMVDIKDERAKALELIRRQRLIADDLLTFPLARAQEVCRDLENIFMEIASLNDCARSEQIEDLRRLVESRQLLLRLDLVSDQLRKGNASNV